MSWTLFTRTLYQRRTALLWYSVSLIAYSLFVSWYFPYLERMNITQYLNAFPKELIDAFAGSSGVSLSTFGGYTATEYLGVIWVLIIAAAAISFSTKAISSEVAGGTMELLLAQPISRRVLVFTRWVAMIVYVGLLALATTAPLYFGAVWRDVDVVGAHFVLLTVAAWCFAVALGSAALGLSAVFNESSRAAAIIGGTLGVMWLLSFMSANLEWAKALNPVNVFHWWEPARMIDKGTVAAGSWGLYAALILAGLATALIVFPRRDVG